jgi:hypothetical protein
MTGGRVLSCQRWIGHHALRSKTSRERPLKTLDSIVLVTPDKNIHYQQNLKMHAIAAVVLGNPQWPVLRQHVERVVAAVNTAMTGTYCEVEIPDQ